MFASAKVNLNIAGPAHWGAPTNRYFNIPACGALELCDWSEGLDAFLVPDREMFYYCGSEDIEAQVETLLTHRSELSPVIQAARSQIAKRFTYAQWVDRVFHWEEFEKLF